MDVFVKEQMIIRTPYNYDRDLASDLSSLHCSDPTLTQQQFQEECDINTIVRRFGVTGEMPQQFEMPTMQDFTEAVNDYQTAMNMLIEARDSFMTLPAEVRAKFDNDPQKLMTFVEDKDNMEEARRLGLLREPDAAPEPMLVKMVAEPPAQ